MPTLIKKCGGGAAKVLQVFQRLRRNGGGDLGNQLLKLRMLAGLDKGGVAVVLLEILDGGNHRCLLFGPCYIRSSATEKPFKTQ